MPNHRGTGITHEELETAHPWADGHWDPDGEPQEARGPVHSRGRGTLARQREHHHPSEWSGVRPLPPLLPEMPRAKPGDQGG